MAQIQLFKGERDGDIVKITAERPEVFYALPPDAEDKVKAVVGTQAKVALKQRLSTMAYKYYRTVTRSGVGVEYQYVRSPELDLPQP